MKKIAISILLVAGLAVSSSASAFWNNNNYNECWGNPYDCNPYDPWDPRYWFEEMESFFDDDNYPGYGYPMPHGYPQGYQVAPGQMPYQMPYMPRPPYYAPQAPRAPMAAPAPVAPKQPVALQQPAATAQAK